MGDWEWLASTRRLAVELVALSIGIVSLPIGTPHLSTSTKKTGDDYSQARL